MITEKSELEIVPTREGIHTIYNPVVNEHYHSLFGSMQEAMHVFIKNGFLKALNGKEEIRILEMGFGTGLNAILTYRENQIHRKHIRYTAIDTNPLPKSIIEKLNYFKYFGQPLQPLFEQMHECIWFRWQSLGNFELMKIESDIVDYPFDDSYDLIYYDAFSPAHQPEVWTFELFKRIHDVCNPGAALISYCAKGIVKRTLKAAGFYVECLPGPQGKMEMIRAIKI